MFGDVISMILDGVKDNAGLVFQSNLFHAEYINSRGDFFCENYEVKP